MEQKKNEKDVLVVRDKQTGEIGVVTGLNSDGTPKTTPAKGANHKDFLLFDKNSNPVDSFMDNFFRQCKEPTRFGFYRVAADNVSEVIDVFKDLLKDPKNNADLLAAYRIDTSKYEQQIQTVSPKNDSAVNDLDPFWQAIEDHWTSEKKQLQPEAKQVEEQQTKSEEEKIAPIDERRIDWGKLEELYGVNRQSLEESGDLEKMLNYGKSDMVAIVPNIGGERLEMDARLSFKEMPDGSFSLVPQTIRQEPKLDGEFMGHTFSEEDKANLKKSGNMGRVVDLVDKDTGEVIPAFISLDRKTNQIEAVAVKDVPIPTKIGKTELSDHEISELRAGRAIPNKEIVLSESRKFTATLQVNVERGGVEFVPRQEKQRQERKQRNSNQNTQKRQNQKPQDDGEQKSKNYNFQWVDEQGHIRAPKTMGGVELSVEQQKDFTVGKAILVKDMKRDGKGEPFTAYVRYNHEAGKPHYFKNNPDVSQAKEVTPASESRTQVAVNSEGKTNEATKDVKQPLKQGQTQPKPEQRRESEQRKQNKPRRMGM